mmetsp:Transcript_12628/g.39757  ORF Transcript_12628/g.39757 Transcript_12628/m.39757 type:complete len:288 (+) Transcript_12628:106-969(+)
MRRDAQRSSAARSAPRRPPRCALALGTRPTRATGVRRRLDARLPPLLAEQRLPRALHLVNKRPAQLQPRRLELLRDEKDRLPLLLFRQHRHHRRERDDVRRDARRAHLLDRLEGLNRLVARDRRADERIPHERVHAVRGRLGRAEHRDRSRPLARAAARGDDLSERDRVRLKATTRHPFEELQCQLELAVVLARLNRRVHADHVRLHLPLALHLEQELEAGLPLVRALVRVEHGVEGHDVGARVFGSRVHLREELLGLLDVAALGARPHRHVEGERRRLQAKVGHHL